MSSSRLSLPFVTFALITSILPALNSLMAAPLDEGERFFEQRVRPILVQHCVSCHGPKKQESGLRLDSKAGAFAGGDSGPAVVPRRPEESLLIEAVRRDGLEMPPEIPLEDDEVKVLEAWVQRGAPWADVDTPPTPALGDQRAIRAESSSHWAFQPLAQPETPKILDATGERLEPIDAFVRASLQRVGLQPSEPADRRTLIRRAYFDVIGLPPSARAVRDFVNDTDADAFARVVDELLDSEHYGERWARHWLDVARYADTRDWRAQTDPRYPFAYTYRDYVIQSLNADKPYDQFIREQLAADCYAASDDAPELAALGFLTVGPRFRDNALEQVADRIDVVTRGLMALTVTCARCHDHKYDAIPSEDYYSLYGVFASTKVPDQLPRIRGGSVDASLLADFEEAHAAKIADLDEYGRTLQREAGADLRQNLARYFAAYYEMSVTKTSQIRGVLTKHKVKETAMTPLAARLDRINRRAVMRRDRVFGPWVQALNLTEPQYKRQAAQQLATWSERPGAVNPQVLSELQNRRPATRRALLDAYVAVFEKTLQSWTQRRRSAPNATKLEDADLEEVRLALLGDDGAFRFTVDEVVAASRLLGKGRRKLGDLEKAIREVEATHPGSPPRAMAVTDKPQIVEPYVMLRGEPRRRGESVPRRFLWLVGGDDRTPFTSGSGRRELAEAITAADNPLTARVLVNRVWMKYFGTGLVSTPGDFGLRSDPPSHPELLDWLASTFIADGWSLKRLHRRILLSRTYQQSSLTTSTEATRKDPENRLLWRANRKRLDFESMRDAMLAASGTIDLDVGGRSVRLSDRPFTTRRTLYGYVDRVDMDPLFKTFDVPSPDASAASRPQTTVPQQALFAMNHPFVVEQARALTRRLDGLDDDAEKISQLYVRLLGRKPTADESALALEFVQATPQPTAPDAGVWQYGYGSVNRAAPGELEFAPLAHWSGTEYRVGAEFPDPKLGHLRLTAVGGHPGKRPLAVVRRWTAPMDATIRVFGKVTHRRDKGDGIRARIVLATVEQGTWRVFNKSVAAVVGPLRVKKGQSLDFVVDCVGTPSADAFIWSPVIRQVGVESGGRVWSANSDFAGPLPPPMTAWEQLAQAIMLTNEFLYVD